MKFTMDNSARNYRFILDYSKSLSFNDDVEKITRILIDDPRFKICSGSGRYNAHHYGDGGLICHTAEVINLSNIIRLQYPEHNVNEIELFFAALFHDAGKMFDYEKKYIRGFEQRDPAEPWKKTSHNRLIHHISRSGLIWNDAIKSDKNLDDKYFEKVLHAILAHHTSREAGSPVAPKSRVAWILTLCDNLSARIYDADTLDLIKGK